jgi:hypothetical protein
MAGLTLIAKLQKLCAGQCCTVRAGQGWAAFGNDIGSGVIYVGPGAWPVLLSLGPSWGVDPDAHAQLPGGPGATASIELLAVVHMVPETV